MTSDGKPFAPLRYKEIVTECYYISKNCATSYTDLMKITPLERKYIMDILTKEAERVKEVREETKAKLKQK